MVILCADLRPEPLGFLGSDEELGSESLLGWDGEGTGETEEKSTPGKED
jgi:hypothetical protein